MWNSQLEAMPSEDLRRLQSERLSKIVQYAYERVDYYRRRLSEHGIKPDQIKDISDLPRLPFITKSDLRDTYPFGSFAVQGENVRRVHASSGTRGKPTVSGYSDADLKVWSDLCARSLAATGVRRQDVVHNSYGYGLFTGGMGIHQGAELLGATVIPASGGRTQQQLMLMTDFGARVLCCTPSYALNIMSTLEQSKMDRSALKLEIGIFGAEPWSEECREHLQKGLQIEAFDIYGLSEIMGPGVAIECIARDGLHIWEDHFYPEVIHPETLEPLPDGEFGELVITTLTKECLPLVRYRTGDACAIVPGQCKCGRTMRRITRLRGRLDDMLIIRGVNVYPSEIESVIFTNDHVSPNYQITISRERALDALKVRICICPKSLDQWQQNHSESEEKMKLIEDLSKALKDRLGLSVGIEILPTEALPASEGKAMRIIDLRHENA